MATTLQIIPQDLTVHTNTTTGTTGPSTDPAIPVLVTSATGVPSSGFQSVYGYLGGEKVFTIVLATAQATALGNALTTPAVANIPS